MGHPARGVCTRRVVFEPIVASAASYPACYSCRVMFLGSPPIQPSAPPPVYCAECGCEIDPDAWLCASCGSKLHVPGALTSTSAYAHAVPTNSIHAHSKARAVYRFFLYLGCFAMYVALTWGHDSPDDDPRTSFVIRAVLISILLVLVISDVIIYHSLNSYSLHVSGETHSLGEETFGVVLIALFWSLSSGFKLHTLPAAVYTKHLEGSLAVVFWVILIIILWYDGIFDRR
jgi:hypothetical protein